MLTTVLTTEDYERLLVFLNKDIQRMQTLRRDVLAALASNHGKLIEMPRGPVSEERPSVLMG